MYFSFFQCQILFATFHKRLGHVILKSSLTTVKCLHLYKFMYFSFDVQLLEITTQSSTVILQDYN